MSDYSSPLAPDSSIEDIRRWIRAAQVQFRKREPLASGSKLDKYLLFSEAIRLGLLDRSLGAVNTGNDTISVGSSVVVGGSGGSTSSAPALALGKTALLFLFASGAATTSSDPDITIVANLSNTTGRVAFTAEAFSAAHTSLGAIPFTVASATSVTIGDTDFVNGLGTTVRYVVVTARLGDLSDTATIYRSDAGTESMVLDVTRRIAQVPTRFDGTEGDFTDANSTLVLKRGATEETSLWSFAITAGTNCTVKVNGGGGPATGANEVLVTVSAMTADTASVLITASRTANPDQTFTLYLFRSSLGNSSALVVENDSTTTVALEVGKIKRCTNVALTTATVPAAPANGSVIGVYFTNALLTNVIARNGENIDEAAANQVSAPRGMLMRWQYLTGTGYLRL